MDAYKKGTMETALDRIPELIRDQIEPWVWEYLVRFAKSARLDGATPAEVLRALGLEEALQTRPIGVSPQLQELYSRLKQTAGTRRTEEENLYIRDLVEQVLDSGVKRSTLAETIGVSESSVRNLLNPYYQRQTKEERERYRLERLEIRRARRELL